MAMWHTPLLPFNHMHVSHNRSKGFALDDVLEELLVLQSEDPGDNIWPILSSLSFSQLAGNLWPLWIAGHSYEQCRFAIFSNNGHCILIFLLEPPIILTNQNTACIDQSERSLEHEKIDQSEHNIALDLINQSEDRYY